MVALHFSVPVTLPVEEFDSTFERVPGIIIAQFLGRRRGEPDYRHASLQGY